MNELLTPCIVQTVIICCTIIIIALVGLSGYRIKKQLKQSWHGYVFIASILTILAIIIFSYVFYGNRKVLDFISLASALISIILAIITIIYSFIINNKSTEQIQSLFTTSNKLQEAATNVERASTQYEVTAESLHNNIDRILKKLDGIEAKVGLGSDYENNIRTAAHAQLAENKNIIADFVRQSPLAGVLVFYACYMQIEKRKELNIKAVFDEDKAMYYVGFIMAANSVGISQITIDLDTMTIKNVAGLSAQNQDLITNRITTEIGNNNVFVIETKAKIDKYFSE